MVHNQNGFYAAVEQENRMRSIRSGTANMWPQQAKSTIQQMAAAQDNPKLQIDLAIENFFASVAEKVPGLIRLLAVPRSMASHPILSTNVAMNLLYNPTSSRGEDVESVLEELVQVQDRVPPITEVTALFVGNYLETERTVGECYWLLRICMWLNCALPKFVDRMERKLYVPNAYAPPRPVELNLRNIQYFDSNPPERTNRLFGISGDKIFDFNEIIAEHNILNEELIESSTKQYAVLEEVLRRLCSVG